MSDGVTVGESNDDDDDEPTCVYPDNTRVAIIIAHQKLGKQQLLQVFCIV